MKHLYVTTTEASKKIDDKWIDTYNEIKEEAKILGIMASMLNLID